MLFAYGEDVSLREIMITMILNSMIRVTKIYLSFFLKASIKLCLNGSSHLYLFLENSFLKR